MRGRLMLAVGCLALLVAGHAGAKQGDNDPTIVILVLNVNEVPAATLTFAEGRASRILSRAHVHLRWRQGHRALAVTGTGLTCAAPDVSVIEMAFEDPNSPGELQGALGYAKPFAKDGVRMVIFYRRLSEDQRDPSVLGHIMAHEIGHMLLGTLEHDQSGVMKASWNEREIAGMLSGRVLVFSPAEADRIANRVAQRMPQLLASCSSILTETQAMSR